MLASRFPFPLERGDKLRLYHQLKGLSQHHNIHLFAISEHAIPKDHIKKIRTICTSLHVHHISKTRKFLNLIKGLFKALPFQAAIYNDKKSHSELSTFIKQVNPDLVYCQLIRMAPLSVNTTKHKVIDFMDAYGVGMMRRAKISRWPLNWIYSIEGNRTQRYEQTLLSHFDEKLIISQQDAQEIGTTRLKVLSNGIDLAYFSPISVSKQFEIGFIGNMGYLPNVDAAEILINEVVPRYNEKYNQSIKVMLAGARPHARVQKLASNNVTVTGWVDDIRKAYAECKIICAPLTGGTGQQNKILESMAMQIPCITTTSVNRAIGGQDEQHLMIADYTEEFVDAIYKLLHNTTLYQHIAKEARQFVEKEFSWDAANQQLNTIFESLIKEK